MRYIVRTVAGLRREGCDYLRERLPVEFQVDERRDIIANFEAAFRRQGTDDAVHMEDDVLLTLAFEAKLQAAIEPWRDQLVQMFTCRPKADRAGSRWAPGRDFVHAQCFYVPGADAPRLAEFYAGWTGRPGYDAQACADLGVSDYLIANRRRYRIVVPSLVQHEGNGSLVGHGAFMDRWRSPSFVDAWA